MATTRRSFIAGALALTVLPARAASATVISGPAFGATFRAVFADGVDAEAIAARISAVIARIDGQMSPYRGDSDLTRFNEGKGDGWFPLPDDFRASLSGALALARCTGGAFDPTIGTTVGRYGFGPIRGEEAVSHVDIDLAAPGVRKRRAGVTLDLCGIAKGHALDCIHAALAGLETGDGFLIELGGEIRARGRHPSGRSWRAGVERPAGKDLAATLLLDDGVALATSGDRVNSYRSGDRVYSHIMDGRRRAPADGRVASVSVLAADAMEADGLATGLYALGAEAGPAFAERERVAAFFQIRRDGVLHDVVTGHFGERIVRKAAT